MAPIYYPSQPVVANPSGPTYGSFYHPSAPNLRTVPTYEYFSTGGPVGEITLSNETYEQDWASTLTKARVKKITAEQRYLSAIPTISNASKPVVQTLFQQWYEDTKNDGVRMAVAVCASILVGFDSQMGKGKGWEYWKELLEKYADEKLIKGKNRAVRFFHASFVVFD